MDDKKKYPNSGALFTKEPQGKRPTWSGYLELDGKLLRELVESYKANGEAKLDISGWDRDGRNGNWVSLSCQRYGAWKEKDGGSSRPARAGSDRGRTRSDNRGESDQRRTREDDDQDIPF